MQRRSPSLRRKRSALLVNIAQTWHCHIKTARYQHLCPVCTGGDAGLFPAAFTATKTGHCWPKVGTIFCHVCGIICSFMLKVSCCVTFYFLSLSSSHPYSVNPCVPVPNQSLCVSSAWFCSLPFWLPVSLVFFVFFFVLDSRSCWYKAHLLLKI